MTSKDIDKDELAADLEATEEEAENVTGGLMKEDRHLERPRLRDRHV